MSVGLYGNLTKKTLTPTAPRVEFHDHMSKVSSPQSYQCHPLNVVSLYFLLNCASLLNTLQKLLVTQLDNYNMVSFQ